MSYGRDIIVVCLKGMINMDKKIEKLENKKIKIDEKIAKLKIESNDKIKKKYQRLRKMVLRRREKEDSIKLDPLKYEKRERLRALNNPPVRPVLEEIGNSVTHGVGALLAIVAFILLMLKSNTGLEYLASCVYGLCMFLMMLMSCLYHAFKSGSKVKRLWRRFDYSSIYLLIGGTFAPLYLVYLGNTLGIVLFCIQWVLIITGITFISIFGPGRIKWLHFTMYFVIGWSGLMFIPDFVAHNLPLLWMILGGGVVYTLGMIPFAKKGTNNAHFIWHFFVLLGALVQYLGILLYLY